MKAFRDALFVNLIKWNAFGVVVGFLWIFTGVGQFS